MSKNWKFILLAILSPAYFDGGCDSHHLHSEGHGRFFCYDINGLTVPEYRFCDGFEDCFDGSDERDCHDHRQHYDHGLSNHHDYGHHHQHNSYCLEMEFQCPTRYGSQCIPRHWVCDNYMDCLDGRDEEAQECACSEHEKLCENFYSGSGFCVPWHVSCNSYYDNYFLGGAAAGSHGHDEWQHGWGWGRHEITNF